jgi:hypothetical protein
LISESPEKRGEAQLDFFFLCRERRGRRSWSSRYEVFKLRFDDATSYVRSFPDFLLVLLLFNFFQFFFRFQKPYPISAKMHPALHLLFSLSKILPHLSENASSSHSWFAIENLTSSQQRCIQRKCILVSPHLSENAPSRPQIDGEGIDFLSQQNLRCSIPDGDDFVGVSAGRRGDDNERSYCRNVDINETIRYHSNLDRTFISSMFIRSNS